MLHKQKLIPFSSSTTTQKMAGVLVRSLYKGLTEQSGPSRLLLSQGDAGQGGSQGGGAHAVSLPASAYNSYKTSDYLNPFVWFAVPSVLFAMSAVVIGIIVFQKKKANAIVPEIAEEVDGNVPEAAMTGKPTKALSISEKSVVRKSFIKKFSKTADETRYNGYLHKKASRHVAQGYQRRYFKLSNSGKLTYSKSIFSMHNSSGRATKKSKTFFLVNPNVDSPTILAPALADDSTDLKIIFSRSSEENTDKPASNGDEREVLELRAETVKEAKLWRHHIEEILRHKALREE